MKVLLWWLTIFGAVAIASLADSVSALWAKGEDKLSVFFFLILLLGPLVFFAFGYVTTRVGLAVTSGVVNSLLVLSSMSVGLFIFGEWNKISTFQYIGMILALVGIILMLFFPKSDL